MINTKSFHRLWFTKSVLIATAVVMFCISATAQDVANLFPPEIVNFQPGEANPIFQGRGKGNWDEHIQIGGNIFLPTIFLPSSVVVL